MITLKLMQERAEKITAEEHSRAPTEAFYKITPASNRNDVWRLWLFEYRVADDSVYWVPFQGYETSVAEALDKAKKYEETRSVVYANRLGEVVS